MGKLKRNNRIKKKISNRNDTISLFFMVVLNIGLGFLLNYLQRMIIAPDAYLFGRQLPSWTYMMFAVAVPEIALIIVLNFNEKYKKSILWTFVAGVWLLMILFLSSFYYYVTNQGLYYHQLFSGRMVAWKQIQKVNLRIIHTSRNHYLEYTIITKDRKEMEINQGISYGRLEAVDSFLEFEKVKFEVTITANELRYNLRGLDDYEKEILVNHYPKAERYLPKE